MTFSARRSSWRSSKDFRHDNRRGITAPSTPVPPFGPLLRTITPDDLFSPAKSFLSSATITDVTTLATFNWLNKPSSAPTILIPGKPPLYTPPPTAPRLREDSPIHPRDKNAYRYPSHPTEPAVVALLDSNPTIPSTLDILACGNTMGNLLRFVRGQEKPFRMLVDKIGNTAFLVRRENSPREMISDVRGYGHTFPEAYVTWEVEGVSHQRIVGYEFGGLRVGVRFEGDGCLPNGSGDKGKEAGDGKKMNGVDGKMKEKKNDELGDLVGAMKSLGVDDTAGGLKVERGGEMVEQERVFDLKTRSIKTKDKDHAGEAMPRLWVAQIPWFVLAFHRQGVFEKGNILTQDMRDGLKTWEEDNREVLARFAALLGKIAELVSEDGRVELRCFEVGKLEVRKWLDDAGDVLSSDVRTRWVDGRRESREDDLDDLNLQGSDLDETHTDWEDAQGNDFTACSADQCGYCGRCDY
ncbi:hypothetical protein OQA88_3247 [Cercophora sp. LCS_1]